MFIGGMLYKTNTIKLCFDNLIICLVKLEESNIQGATIAFKIHENEGLLRPFLGGNNLKNFLKNF